MKHKGRNKNRANAALRWVLLFAAGVFAPGAVFPVDHRGTEFWICFPPNMAQPYVFITAESGANVTLDIPGLAWSDSFAVAAGEGIKRAVPAGAQFDSLTDDGTEAKGVHVRATGDIAVYGYSGDDFNQAGFLALPVSGLGYEYLAACYTDAANGTPPGHFLVLAAENDTAVTVIPSDDYGSRMAGSAYTVSLDQGEIYRLGGQQSGTTYDLTGSRICSDKPVAVYIGAPGGYLPGNLCCSDAIVDQAPPVSDLGTDYLLVPYINRDMGDFVRIVAANAGTQVLINGAIAAVLNQGEFHDVNLFVPIHVTSNQPVMVTQFMKSEDTDYMWGDPELMVVTPTANFLPGYLAMTDDSPSWANYCNIVVPTDAIEGLLVDDIPVSSADFSPIASSGYSYGRLPIETGAHAFSCSSPFGAYIYGKYTYSSYAFSAGMALEACKKFRVEISPPRKEAFRGQEVCLDFKITDLSGVPLPSRTFEVLCNGANPWQRILGSDANGMARFCYLGQRSGVDEIEAASACWCDEGPAGRATVLWAAPGTLRVFPNPFDRKIAVRGTVKFEGLELGTRIRIYTVRGLKVWEGTIETPYILEWDGRNESGDPVAPGTYLWVAESGGSKQQGTLLVE